MLQPIILQEVSPSQKYEVPNDRDRKRRWLKSAYSAMRWYVCSNNPEPGEKPTPIDFDLSVRGGNLTKYPELIKAAKEFVFWHRELCRSDTASTMRNRAQHFLKFCVFLANKGISSFSQLTAQVYVDAIDAWVEGGEQLLGNEAVILDLTSQFLTTDDVPEQFIRRPAKGEPVLHRTAILAHCGLNRAGPASRVILDNEDRRLGFAEPRKPKKRFRPGPIVDDPDSDDEDENAWVLTKHVNMMRQSGFWFMYESRGVLRCQNFTFDPGQHINRRGKDTESTPVPPPDLCFDLHAAAYTVTSTSQTLLSARREQLVKQPGKNVQKARAEAVRWTGDAMRFALCTWLQTIMMTVRRPREIFLMRRDCIHGDAVHGWYVKIYIVKSRKEWIFIPVPPSVIDAINKLIDLSPNEPRTGPLFALRSLVDGKLTKLSPGSALRAFAEEAKLVDYIAANDIPARWHWQPRQFRRYTAHLHFWGYSGSVAVISHILDHFSLRESSVYTKLDKGMRSAWKRVKEEFSRHIAKQAIAGELGGAGGKALTRDAKRLEASMRERFAKTYIIDPDHLVDGMLEVIRRKMLVIVPKAWVICSCPATKGAARRAMCRKQAGEATTRAIGPDFGRAGPHVCKGCIWAIENEVTRQFASKDIKSLELSCAQLEGTVLGDMQRAGVVNFLQIERDPVPAA